MFLPIAATKETTKFRSDPTKSRVQTEFKIRVIKNIQNKNEYLFHDSRYELTRLADNFKMPASLIPFSDVKPILQATLAGLAHQSGVSLDGRLR